MVEAQEDATNIVKETTEGDRLLSHICRVLNNKVYQNEVSNVEEVIMKNNFPLSRQFTINIANCIYFRILPFSKLGRQNMFELSSGEKMIGNLFI